MLPDVNANDGNVSWKMCVSKHSRAAKDRHVQSSGSWLGVVTISSLLVSGLKPSQPQPEPWMAAVTAFILVLNSALTGQLYALISEKTVGALSTEPKSRSRACLRGPSSSLPPP